MEREAEAAANLLQPGRQTTTGRTGQTEIPARDHPAGLREGRSAAFPAAVPPERSDSCGARGCALRPLHFYFSGSAYGTKPRAVRRCLRLLTTGDAPLHFNVQKFWWRKKIK